MLTLSQIQNSTVANIAGVNVNDPQFASYINDAVRQLMDLGDWWATVVDVKGCIYGGVVTWPTNVQTVLAVNINHQHVPVTNFWYSFSPVGDSAFRELIRNPIWFGGWPHGHAKRVVEFDGRTPLFAAPTATNPFAIQVTADNPADYGKFVTVYGYDTSGLEVTSNQDGIIQRGIRMTLAASAPNTVTAFSMVTHVTKDLTVGNVRAWQYFSPFNNATLCGIFAGGETSPEYLYSKIHGTRCDKTYDISALVKLGFVAVQNPSDIVPIGNLDAIKSMVQAIKARESGGDGDQAADKYETTALRRLNMELNNRFPLDQIKIQNETFSGITPHRRIF